MDCRKKIVLLIILVFNLLYNTKLNAKYNYVSFERLSTQHGLSDNTINSIAQDSKGFIWFATDNGLNRFDGFSITHFKHKANTPNTLSSNLVKTMLIDRYDFLWIGTVDGGLQCFDTKKEQFTSYNFGLKGDITNSNDIFTIYEDRNGRLWVGTYGGGLNLILRDHKSVKFQYFTVSDNHTFSISSNNIRSITQLENGTLWLGTEDNGISILENPSANPTEFIFRHLPTYTLNGNEFKGAIMSIEEDESFIWVATWGNGIIKIDKNDYSKQTQLKLNDHELGNIITKIYKDFNKDIWISTWGNGLFVLNQNDECAGHWQKSVWQINNISENKIWTIFEDNHNTFWIGTNEGGANRFNINNKKFNTIRSLTSKSISLTDNEVQCIEELPDGKILIGTRSGGLNVFNPETHTVSKFDVDFEHISILSLNIDSTLNLWIGTDGNGLIKLDLITKNIKTYQNIINDTNSISNNSVFSIFELNKNKLIVGTWGGGFSIFDKQTEVFKNYTVSNQNVGKNVVVSIDGDSQGNVWMASFGAGLLKYNPKNDNLIYFNYNKYDNKSIASNTLRQVYVDKYDNIWVGTNSHGLSKYDIEKGRFVHFNNLTGLSNFKIEGIESDTLGNIWISGNNGISKISNNEIDIFNFGIDDGLQGNEFCIGAMYKAKNGKMYAGGIHGMNQFNPYTIKIDTLLPKIVITDLKIHNKSVKVGQLINGIEVLRQSISNTKFIKLHHSDNNISFEFSALDFIPNHTNKFAYKLDGFEQEWTYTNSKLRNAHYTNLDPGEYVFTVIGANSDDVWNTEGISIGIVIAPPFWHTWWFYMLSSFVVLFLLYLFIKKRNQKLNIQKQLLETEVTIRTRTIESQKTILEHRLEELKIKSKELEEKNEQIQLQNEVVLSYVKEIESKREEVLQQKQEIIESIMYARRIQKALFPSKQYLDFILDDYFIYFKPRDIVSGDYYWIAEKEGKLIVVVADCTGHGVPGAFMSLLGISFLNEIVNKEISFKANEILNQVRSSVISSLNQTGQDDEAKDGMDMSLCIIDKDEKTIQYAGANNPMYLFGIDGEFRLIKADKMPIGIYLGEEHSFSCQVLEYKKGDTIYMFSDGYIDQFGGEKGKKFKSNRFKSLISEIQDKNMRQQKVILNKTINEWMAHPNPNGYNNFQVDDILVVGIRL